MKKFTTTILLFAVLMTVAYSDIYHDFLVATGDLMLSRPILLDQYYRQQNTTIYYLKHSTNRSCFDDFAGQIVGLQHGAAQQWNYNASILESIVTNLYSVAYPPVYITGKSCVDPDTFSEDDNAFNSMTKKVFANNSLMMQTYIDLSDEIGFFTKGGILSDQQCVKTVADLVEFYRISSVSELANGIDGYSLVAKAVYAMLPDTIKMSQKCLVGDDDDLFNEAYDYWIEKNPDQKAYYDKQDDMVVSLTKILKHDDICAQKLDKELQANLKVAYGQFRNGTARIGDLAMRVLHVYLADTVNQARYCLSA